MKTRAEEIAEEQQKQLEYKSEQLPLPGNVSVKRSSKPLREILNELNFPLV